MADRKCPVCGEAMMLTKLTGMLRCNNPVCGDMHVLIPADYETYSDRLATERDAAKAENAELKERVKELEARIEAASGLIYEMPSVDLEANPNDTGPDDMIAHLSGLALKALKGADDGTKMRKLCQMDTAKV